MNPASRCESCNRRRPDVRLVERHGVRLWLCGEKACRSRQGRMRAMVKAAPVERRVGAQPLLMPELERRKGVPT